MSNIIDRLGLQSDAFQESFNMLSQAKTLEELAKKFFLVLRGNLLIVNAAIYFKSSHKSEWRLLFSKDQNPGAELTAFFSDHDEFTLSSVDHPKYALAISHPLIDKATFGILLGSKLDKTGYNEFDKIAMQFFSQQLDSSYQFFISRKKEKKLIFELNHRVLQLNSLIDTGIEVARLQEGSQLLELALERVLALTNASKGMLQVKKGNVVKEKTQLPYAFKPKDIAEKYIISAEFKFTDRKYFFYLYEQESREGMLPFDPTDQLLLDAFARQVHVSLENHYLYEQSLEKERVEKEISLAGAIQSKLIPEQLPVINGYDQYGINIPTKFIGGDYYDCIELKDGRFMFIMADVSGKGVAAGLLVSTLQASAHAYLDSPFEITSLVQKLNEVIHDAATIEKYITAVFAVLDPQSGELISVNAGHNPTYILRKNKKVDELLTGGIPLGMMRMAFPYESSTTVLNKGDSILFYTDGVTEAMNEDEEEYDDLRPLKNFLITNSDTSAEIFITQLLKDLEEFTGETEQSDDITALYITKKD